MQLRVCGAAVAVDGGWMRESLEESSCEGSFDHCTCRLHPAPPIHNASLRSPVVHIALLRASLLAALPRAACVCGCYPPRVGEPCCPSAVCVVLCDDGGIARAQAAVTMSKTARLKQSIAKHQPVEARNRHSAPGLAATPSPPLPPSSSSSFSSPTARELRPSTVVAHAAAEKRRLADEERDLADASDADKRQRLTAFGASPSSLSSSAQPRLPPLHLPDPNAAPDRVKRKTPAKPINTSAASSSSPPSQMSPFTPSTSTSHPHPSAYPSPGTALAGMSDSAAEHQFYETILSWDPTRPRDAFEDDATGHAAPPSSSPSSSSGPSPSTSPPPPAMFPSGAAYQAFFRPLLLLDFLSQLQQSYEANLLQPHSFAAQLQPLTVTAVEERDGRGASQSMFTVHLTHINDIPLDMPERRRKQGQLREWVAGDLALLRHHVRGEDQSAGGAEHDGGGKGKRHRREREKMRKQSLGRVDHFVMCVIDNVEAAYGKDGAAPLCILRVRVHLPQTAATLPRVRAMWELLHPKATVDVDEKQSERRRAVYEGVYSVVRLDSPVTTVREFIALQHVDSLTLLPHLLNPAPSWTSSSSSVTTDSLLQASTGVSADELESFASTLPEQYRGYLSSHLNAYQLQAVQRCAFRCRQPGFTLLQGPPGTGKTKTVVSILNSLHLRAYQAHYTSLIRHLLAVPKSVLATLRRTIAGDTSSQPIAVDELISDLTALPSSSSSSSPSPFSFPATPRILPKPRLLVCAPSNAGVDEIITRVLGVESSSPAAAAAGGFVDGKLVRYSPDIVRIGQSESVREEVKEKISLDVLVDGYMKLSVEQLEARARHAARARVDTKRELDQWVQTYRKRWEAAVKHGDASAPEPEPSEVVEPHFLTAVAHLHERLHLATLDADRCQSILTLYHTSNATTAHHSAALPSASAPPALSKERRAAALDRLRLSFLNEAHIVFSTLSGAGLPILSSSLSHPFSAVLVDEAAQATELSTLVAFRHNPPHVILVGDPRQLPATVFLHREVRARRAVERSLFERLQEGGGGVQTLLVQYRMHREVREFPSRYFYEGRLVDGEVVGGPGYVKEFHRHALCKPMMLFDVRVDEYERGGEREEVQRVHAQYRQEKGKSSGNVTEAAFVARMVEQLLTLYPTEVRGMSIGCVTFYQQQKRILEQMMADMRGRVAGVEGVEVSTVDGFQGREKEVIIVSCVRQRRDGGGGGRGGGKGVRGIGFVSDIRRMNVALTRGKWAMWVCGDVDVLSEGSVEWKALVDDARSRGLLKRWRDVRNEDARWLPFQRSEPSRAQSGWKSTTFDDKAAAAVPPHQGGDDLPLPALERVVH